MSQSPFLGMTITRLIAHTIHPRGSDKQLVVPTCSDQLMALDGDALDLIQLRLTEALGHSSHGVEVGIQNGMTGSFMQLAAGMIRADDADFVAVSKTLAMQLAEAQTHPRLPGGVLIIISGAIGQISKRFVAAIKAETDKGFNFEQNGETITLRLVKKMLLSATQRLYKIGLLVETTAAMPNEEGLFDPANYGAFLFDHLLTATETKPAAAYFYSGFLGMDILKSAKHHTRLFFEETKNYINTLPLPDEDRYALRESLRAVLRSNTPTITSADFAQDHLPEAARAGYVAHLTSKGFPSQAVVKDTDYIKNRLRRPRQVLFSSGVQIRVPSDQDFGELVTIEGAANGVTKVSVRGTVQDQD